MKNYIFLHLLIGLIFYSILAYRNRASFNGAEIASIARGLLLGVVLWPIALLYLLILTIKA